LFGLGKSKKSANKDGVARITRRKSTVKLNGSVNKLFHGVAVRARGGDCCEAVEELEGQRFLSEEAPLLPLAQCSNPQGCRCVYEHFDERRDNLRRESDVGMPVRTHLDEKRDGHGRRITDG